MSRGKVVSLFHFSIQGSYNVNYPTTFLFIFYSYSNDQWKDYVEPRNGNFIFQAHHCRGVKIFVLFLFH